MSTEEWIPVPPQLYEFRCEGLECKRPAEYCRFEINSGLILCKPCREIRLAKQIAYEMEMNDEEPTQ